MDKNRSSNALALHFPFFRRMNTFFLFFVPSVRPCTEIRLLCCQHFFPFDAVLDTWHSVYRTKINNRIRLLVCTRQPTIIHRICHTFHKYFHFITSFNWRHKQFDYFTYANLQFVSSDLKIFVWQHQDSGVGNYVNMNCSLKRSLKRFLHWGPFVAIGECS